MARCRRCLRSIVAAANQLLASVVNSLNTKQSSCLPIPLKRVASVPVSLLRKSPTFLLLRSSHMGCAQSAPFEESPRVSSKIGKLWLTRRKERRELKVLGRWPPSPVVQDPAPWVDGHKIVVLLQDGHGLFVQADTTP